jgi:aspartate/methionine/tyrosine aminotransferase
MIDNTFLDIPHTGVIRMMSLARKSGFYYGNEEWANLGQGAPDTSFLDGGLERIRSIDLNDKAPSVGLPELRESVANLYNDRYRVGVKSKYSADNVCIVAGGRLALARVCALMKNIHLGHVLPDYTAYSELLNCFGNIVPIPVPLERDDGFCLSPAKMKREIVDRGLSAFLLSNPCNPTGQVASGRDIQAWVDICVRNQCTLILDEFYSHYLYGDSLRAEGPSVSCARYVKDVNKDPVIIIDGITKNWRYPGFRVSWIVGPKDLIGRLGSIGSFLDGGAPKLIQESILPIINIEAANIEAKSIQREFGKKRDLVVNKLRELNLKLYNEPSGAFYCFASLENMPRKIRDGHSFAELALSKKVIVVPGEYFDVNPGRRRSHIRSRLSDYIRISFGPNISQVEMGLERFSEIIDDAR